MLLECRIQQKVINFKLLVGETCLLVKLASNGGC